jgi:prepilin-type N-terminal cleavage/methylation domain-containing protein
MKSSQGFALIELLLVAAMVAVLAAIALPRFKNAQVRSQVSYTHTDLRAIAVSIEAYQVDTGKYPTAIAPTSQWGPRPESPSTLVNGPSFFNPGLVGISSRFGWLTTPVAYLESVPRDPFVPQDNISNYDTYDYADAATYLPDGRIGGNRGASVCSGAHWHVVGAGPDRIDAFGGGPNMDSLLINQQGVDYDPTNGTVSAGDIVRIGDGPGPLVEGGPLPAIDRVRQIYNF